MRALRAAAWLLPLLALAAWADEESALYFLSRAKDALASNDLDRAAEFLEKSGKEMEAYAPTLLVMAELAKRRDDRKGAIQCLELCLEQRNRTELSSAEREAIASAEKMLAELDEARAELRRVVADHVKELLRLAATTKDPALAKECWRTVLLLDPDNPEAQAALGGKREGPAEASGTPLFNGKDLDGWTGGGSAWTVRDGVLCGRLDGANVIRVEQALNGDFSLACEMRVREDLREETVFGILFGMKGSYDHFGLYLWRDGLRLERTFEENRRSDLARHTLKRLSEKFNRADWHTYRIKVEGKRIRCYVDDREIVDSSAADRELDGPIGIWLQDLSVEIRSFTLVQAK